MNRIVLMVLRNILRVPGLYWKLDHYAKHTDEYPEQEKWDHIHKIMHYAITSGNIDLTVTGEENLPEKDGFVLYGNHQGLFDVVALAGTCKRPLAAVLKKELENVPLLKQIRECTYSFAMDREGAPVPDGDQGRDGGGPEGPELSDFPRRHSQQAGQCHGRIPWRQFPCGSEGKVPHCAAVLYRLL